MGRLATLLLILLPLLVLHVGPCAGLRQYIMFHLTSSCESTPDRVITQQFVPNLEPLNRTVQARYYKSFYIFGMWQVARCTGLYPYPCSTSQEYINFIGNEGRCEKWDETGALEVKRIGDMAMASTELYLFESVNYANNSLVATVSTQGLLSISLTVKSFVFIGRNEWRVYEGLQYSGKSRCLHPSEDVRRLGYGFTANPNIDYTVRSVRFGCNAATTPSLSFSLGVLLASIIALLSIKT